MQAAAISCCYWGGKGWDEVLVLGKDLGLGGGERILVSSYARRKYKAYHKDGRVPFLLLCVGPAVLACSEPVSCSKSRNELH